MKESSCSRFSKKSWRGHSIRMINGHRDWCWVIQISNWEHQYSTCHKNLEKSIPGWIHQHECITQYRENNSTNYQRKKAKHLPQMLEGATEDEGCGGGRWKGWSGRNRDARMEGMKGDPRPQSRETREVVVEGGFLHEVHGRLAQRGGFWLQRMLNEPLPSLGQDHLNKSPEGWPLSPSGSPGDKVQPPHLL